jgi:FtsP/CotA-like multicopper oxidase with cupredoxin domain
MLLSTVMKHALAFGPASIVACAVLGCGQGSSPAVAPGPEAGGGLPDGHADATSAEPPGFQDGISLTEATDRNPDPNIVEIDLEARAASVELVPGTKTDVLSYNGSCPGPLIRAKVGDRIIVHFKNSLSEPTTVHWHGIRVPQAMDGTPASQDPVAPGGTFDYDFRVPDAGLYWYHPHMDSAAQVGSGLYGALVVEDPSEGAAFGDEVIMVLSDIDLLDGGILRPPINDPLVEVFGSEGNTILVNGRNKPRLLARAGLRQRWRVVNAAKTRYFQLALAGHTFVRIGGDGGFIESPVESDMIVLAPGERADLSMVPRADAGSDVVMRWIPYDRGYGSAFARLPEDMLTLHIDASDPVTPAPLPQHLRTIQPLDLSSANTQSVILTYAPKDAGPDSGALQINGRSSDAMLMANVGDTDIWNVENHTDWDHPFHLHGFFFQPLDANGQPIHEWKDTYNVPANGKRSFVVNYDNRPGDWMFHCHILEHAELGMMGMLMLAP